MAGRVAANVLTSFSFYQGNGKPKSIGFCESNLLEINPNNTRNTVIWSLKLKAKRMEVYKFVELLILALHKTISYQFFVILLERTSQEQESQNDQYAWCVLPTKV